MNDSAQVPELDKRLRKEMLEELNALRERVSQLETALGMQPPDPLASALIALSSNCIYVAQDGVIRLASPGFQALVQYPADALQGMHVTALVHPDEAAAVRNDVPEAITKRIGEAFIDMQGEVEQIQKAAKGQFGTGRFVPVQPRAYELLRKSMDAAEGKGVEVSTSLRPSVV